jgi:hypothetical protein
MSSVGKCAHVCTYDAVIKNGPLFPNLPVLGDFAPRSVMSCCITLNELCSKSSLFVMTAVTYSMVFVSYDSLYHASHFLNISDVYFAFIYLV